MRALSVVLTLPVVFACATAAPPAPAPAPPSARVDPEPNAEVHDPAERDPQHVSEIWACARVLHPLADFHRARIELRDDGSFTLHHVNTTPDAGVSTFVEGRFAPEASGLVLTPVAATRRRWVGDGHRHDHGESVPYRETTEPVSTAPWTLERADDPEHGEAYRVTELQTRVYRIEDGQEPPPCDDVRPSR